MRTIGRVIRRLRYGRPVIVVSGLPRSGTSLMMQILRAGGVPILTDAIRTPDGSNPRGYFELEAVKDLDKGRPPVWLRAARGKAVKIVTPLVRCLPAKYNYRVIFMQRPLEEVIASQNRMLAERGTPQDETRNVRVREMYRAHVEQTLRILHARPCFSTIVVDYGEAVAHPEDTARRVAAFLGQGLDIDRMAAAAEPALYREKFESG